jgi:hypothetical protein
VSEAGKNEALEATLEEVPAEDGASEPEADPAEDFASKPERKQSDLLLRLGTAAVLIPFVLWIIALGSWPYIGVVMSFGLIAQYEFYNMI